MKKNLSIIMLLTAMIIAGGCASIVFKTNCAVSEKWKSGMIGIVP